MTVKTDELKRRAEAAQSEYEQGYAKLFRDSERREKLYSDEEHQDRVQTLDRERSRTLDAVIQEVREGREAAERELSGLEDGDLTSVLSPEDIAAAAARKPFVDDDVRNATQGRLAAKLRAVLIGGDKASIFAHWHAAKDRYDAILDELGTASRMAGRAPEGLGPQDLREALEGMRSCLTGPERLGTRPRGRERPSRRRWASRCSTPTSRPAPGPPPGRGRGDSSPERAKAHIFPVAGLARLRKGAHGVSHFPVSLAPPRSPERGAGAL